MKRFIQSTAIKFTDSFTASYTPASFNTLYTNVHNNWDIYCAGSGTIGRFNGSSFYEGSGSTGSQMSKIYRDTEGYSIYRPTELSFKFSTYSEYGGATETGNSYIEVSICGDEDVVKVLGSRDQNTTANFGGIALSGMHFTYPTGSEVALLVNGTKVATHSNVLDFNATYYMFLKTQGLDIYYDWNQTGVVPETYAHSYTASSLTQLSNKLICGIASSASNNAERTVTFDDLNIFLL